MWWVWRGQCLLRGWKSTTRRGEPSDFGVTIILDSHSTGEFTGSFSSTPKRQSRAKPALTSETQCLGMEAGACTATGLASGSTNRRSGGLSFINGNGWCSQILKAEGANLSRMNFFSFGRFSLVGGHESVGGSVGGNILVGQEHGKLSESGIPVLTQVLAMTGDSESATVGYVAEINPSCMQASLLMNGYGMDLLT